jgi:hypothetical protein
MSRTYEPIWVRLKEMKETDATHTGVSITAPAALHKRIIKAVIKEKWMDVGYRILLKEQRDKKATLIYKRTNSILTFKLTFTIGIHDV